MVEVNSGSFKMIALNPNRYGGTEGASFCALTTLCKELDTFNAIDVYQVIFFSVTDNKLERLSLANLVLFYIALERGEGGGERDSTEACSNLLRNICQGWEGFPGANYYDYFVSFVSDGEKNIFQH